MVLTAQAALARAELARDRAAQQLSAARQHLGALWNERAPRFDAAGDPLALPTIAPLEALAAAARADAGTPIHLEAAVDDIARTSLLRRETLPPLQDSPAYAAQFERSWSLGSFSALVRGLDAGSSPSTTLSDCLL